MQKVLNPAFGYGDPIWPKQTELEIRLYGKFYHHDVTCSASSRGPIGTSGCSCKYREGRQAKKL